MFVNLSNHPSSGWSKEQHEAASQYGEIKDIPFPVIDPGWDSEKVAALASLFYAQVVGALQTTPKNSAVHIAGEPVFCFYLICSLLREDYIVLASTTERIVKEDGDRKVSKFIFVQFRQYK